MVTSNGSMNTGNILKTVFPKVTEHAKRNKELVGKKLLFYRKMINVKKNPSLLQSNQLQNNEVIENALASLKQQIEEFEKTNEHLTLVYNELTKYANSDIKMLIINLAQEGFRYIQELRIILIDEQKTLGSLKIVVNNQDSARISSLADKFIQHFLKEIDLYKTQDKRIKNSLDRFEEVMNQVISQEEKTNQEQITISQTRTTEVLLFHAIVIFSLLALFTSIFEISTGRRVFQNFATIAEKGILMPDAAAIISINSLIKFEQGEKNN